MFNFTYHTFIYLLHIFIAGPLFLYLGWLIKNQKPIDSRFGLFLLVLGTILIIWHLYLLYQSRNIIIV